MKEILDFLTESKVFFLATVDKDQPRVRPLGFVMEYEGKLSFCTSNKKDMFNQMKANPKAEICASLPDGRFLRISGKIAFNPSVEAKQKALETVPFLRKMYSPDDGIFEIFYFESGVAVFSDMKGSKREQPLG